MAAYTLGRVLDRDQVEEQLRARGYDGSWLEHALEAIDAIHAEGRDWEKAARRKLSASRAGSASGTTEVPLAASVLPSVPMHELTTNEAAERLDVTPRQVRALATSRQLPARRCGRAWLLDEAAVNQRAAERAEDI